MATPDEATRTVLTIGTFDGVHAGHRALVRLARSRAEASDTGGVGGTRVVVLAFDPHPASVLRPGSEPPRLSSIVLRRRLLLEAGADEVAILQPTPDLLALSPEDFLGRIVERYRPRCIVEGPDFRFGAGRAGDTETLRTLGVRFGFEVRVLEPIEAALVDRTVVPVRSTVIRWLLKHGRVADAALLLERPYSIEATVVRGDRRGRTIGFPTLNLSFDAMPPGDGVYSARAALADGRVYAAAVNVGGRPTFAGAPPTVEAHLIGVPTAVAVDGTRVIEGLPEYGFPVTLEFVAYLRDTARFENVDALRRQLAADVERARRVADRAPVRVREGPCLVSSSGAPEEEKGR